ncbi:MAG: hypothetical protein HYZ08_01070 [Candidatus Kerfeldbacteria bacterium]|nr:hypothetical protein [Candidatus Kerfeldbacteria bacterium]
MTTQEQLSLERLLIETYERGASDLVLTVGNPPMMQVDGTYHPSRETVLSDEEVLAVQSLLVPEVGDRIHGARRSKISGVTFRGDARFRVYCYTQEGHPAISIRFIPKVSPQLSKLGFSEDTIETLRSSRGLIVIGSRPGHGKTTTFASIIDLWNSEREEHMIVIQQPIEHLFVDNKSIIDQQEVGRDVPSFDVAIRDSAKESATILAVDGAPLSSFPMLIERAASGQTVLATMERLSALDVLDVLMTEGMTDRERRREELARVLSMILIQALVPKVQGGRALVHEILIANSGVRQMVAHGSIPQLQSMMETSRGEGMIGFDQHLALLVREGHIDLAEARNFSVSPESFDALQSHGTFD